MIRIGFVFPSSDYLHDPFRGDPHTHFQILTVLEGHFGSQVQLSLIDLRGIRREFALYHVDECDLYLHSVYSLDYEEQTSLVRGLRRRYPKAKHVAGGPHATVFQKECLEIFDALILGDGEDLIVQLVQDFRDGTLKKLYDQKEGVDINRFPFPVRHYLPKSTIARPGLMTMKTRPGYDRLISTTVIFSRGCPYKCHFCSMPETKQFGLGIRFREPSHIESEIEYLKKEYGMEGISLLDEIAFPLSRAKALPHLEAIGRTGIAWRAQCRVDGVTSEIARMLKQAGCVTMCMGVESVSQRCLDIINKKISIEQTRKSIALLKKEGIETRIYMILGLPGEPEDIVEQTWDFIQETSPDLVYLSLFTIRPGTEVHKHPEKFGIEWISQDWSKTRHMHGRYDQEIPTLTFRYKEQTPWGKSLAPETIVNNYLELQARLKSKDLASLVSAQAEAHLISEHAG